MLLIYLCLNLSVLELLLQASFVFCAFSFFLKIFFFFAINMGVQNEMGVLFRAY